MRLLVYLPFLCALGFAAAAPRAARRASPRPAAVTLVIVALAVALACDVALVLLAGARLIDSARVASLLHWRAERPGSIPVPLWVSLAAWAGIGYLGIAGFTDWHRSRASSDGLRAVGRWAPAGELTVVRTPELLAHAIPGRRGVPGHILVSDSMLRTLEGPERRVLLEHERSHLRHRHHRHRQLSRLAARMNPLLRPGVEATEFLLERWADEDAARAVGSRSLAARALARAAVATAPARDSALAGFAAHRVSSRVVALLAPSNGGSSMRLMLPASLAIIGVVTAALAAHDLGHVFDVLRGDG